MNEIETAYSKQYLHRILIGNDCPACDVCRGCLISGMAKGCKKRLAKASTAFTEVAFLRSFLNGEAGRLLRNVDMM